MSEISPIENYTNYIKLMDTMSVFDELKKINNIHHSLDEDNVMTYVILRETNKDKFTPLQIEWINNRIDELNENHRKAFENSLSNIDVELAKASILSKSSDRGEEKTD